MFQTKTNFNIKQIATVATLATVGTAILQKKGKCSKSSNCSNGVNMRLYAADRERAYRAGLDDGAYRQWLAACPRYYDGCFSCVDAILDNVFFCRAANRAVFGADVVEIILLA